jgi:hypothetical protein
MWKEWGNFWFSVEEWWWNLISMVEVKRIKKKELKDQGTQTEKMEKERFVLLDKIKWRF